MAKRFTLVVVLFLAGIALPLSANPASAQTGGSLANTSWVLSETAVQRAAFTPALGSPAPTLKFSSDGNLSGSTICNIYNGPYTQNGNTINIGIIISTLRACTDDSLNKQEQLMTSVLQGQVAVTVTSTKLTLSSAAGALNFVPAGGTGGSSTAPGVPATGNPGPADSGSVLPYLLLGLALVTTVAGSIYLYTRRKASQGK